MKPSVSPASAANCKRRLAVRSGITPIGAIRATTAPTWQLAQRFFGGPQDLFDPAGAHRDKATTRIEGVEAVSGQPRPVEGLVTGPARGDPQDRT